MHTAGMVMAAAFIAIAAVACGSATDDGGGASIVAEGEEALELVANAPDATVDGKTARFEGTVEFEVEGESFALEMEGSQDFGTGAGTLTMAAPLGEVAPELDDLHMETVRTSADGVYLNFGSFVDLPEGKRFVFITPDDLGVAPEEALGGEDPTAGLDFLRGVVENPRHVGTDELRGETVQRYDVEVDFVALSEQLAEAAEDFAPTFAEQAEALDELIEGPLDGEVYIDEAGRVRRFAYVLELDQQGVELEITATTDYFDFGVPVGPSAPDAAEVVDFDAVEEEVRDFFRSGPAGLSG